MIKRRTAMDEQNLECRQTIYHEKPFKPIVTYSLIAINIVIFIAMELYGGSQNSEVLRKFGAKVNFLIINGEYWRFITSAFLHIGIPHIVFNMYGLYNLGSLVERIYGSKKYLFIYLMAALWGSAGSFIFSPVTSAGASGAIFGLFGALLYLGQKIPRIFSTSFGINILVVIGFNLIYGFTNSGIDNYAHICGLIGGYLCANITGLKYEKIFKKKKILILGTSLAVLALGILWGVKATTSSWEYHYNLAMDAYYSGKLSESEEHLKSSISAKEDVPEVHALLSLVYYSQGREVEGAQEFERAVNLDKDQPDLYFSLGNIFFSQKRYEEAQSMFQKFVDIRPEQFEGYLNLGVSLNMQGKFQEAEITLKKAAEIAPKELLPNLNLGYLYIDMGNLPEAKQYLEKAARIDPDNEDIKEALQYIYSRGY